MIRDRIVVGLQDVSLSEKLQLDPDLTLEKAVTAARQKEAVKQQQSTLRSQSASTLAASVDAMQAEQQKQPHTKHTLYYWENRIIQRKGMWQMWQIP